MGLGFVVDMRLDRLTGCYLSPLAGITSLTSIRLFDCVLLHVTMAGHIHEWLLIEGTLPKHKMTCAHGDDYVRKRKGTSVSLTV